MLDRKSLRVLHTADVHLERLGDRACQNLRAMVKLCVQSKIDLLVIAGDFFDNNRVENDLVEFAISELESLALPVVILPGNHDCLVPDSVYTRELFARERPNIHVIRAEEGETLDFFNSAVSVWGRPVASYLDLCDRPLAGISSPSGEGGWNIIVAHGNCCAADLTRALISGKENRPACWHYVALGHKGYFNCVCEDPVTACYADSSAIFPYSSVNIVEFAAADEVRIIRTPLDELEPVAVAPAPPCEQDCR